MVKVAMMVTLLLEMVAVPLARPNLDGIAPLVNLALQDVVMASSVALSNGKIMDLGDPDNHSDDGDTRAGDGCSASCEVENRWTCPTEGRPCVRK